MGAKPVKVVVGCITLFVVSCSAPTGGSPNKPEISPPATHAPSPSATVPPTPLESINPAEIAEIQKPPVFVRSVNATQEIPAQPGMGLNIGDTIRTQGEAMAQINLKNGLAFRIGGNSVLTLQPENRLNLTSGKMITWVKPGQKVPAEITTPAAIAGIRGTTAYVEIPANSAKGIRFFSWEGIVAVRLVGQTEAITLKTADEVWIKPGEQNLKLVQQQVRRLPRQEWREQRRTDPLLRSFKTPMPTLPLIERLKPGQLTPDPS